MYETINLKSSCFYCSCPLNGNTFPTIEHLRPTSFGGGREENLVYACAWCNSRRGNQSFVAFFTYIQQLKRQVDQQKNCTSCLDRLRFKKVEKFDGVFICGTCKELKNEKQIGNISILRSYTEMKRYRRSVSNND